MSKILRIHYDRGTVDQAIVGKSPKAPQTEAYYVMREGIWDGDTLYPPSTIVKIEIISK